jgi:hypothetical protein
MSLPILRYENHPSLPTMAMNMFDICKVVIDSKSAVRAQPFKHHLTGGKYDANSN